MEKALLDRSDKDFRDGATGGPQQYTNVCFLRLSSCCVENGVSLGGQWENRGPVKIIYLGGRT